MKLPFEKRVLPENKSKTFSRMFEQDSFIVAYEKKKQRVSNGIMFCNFDEINKLLTNYGELIRDQMRLIVQEENNMYYFTRSTISTKYFSNTRKILVTVMNSSFLHSHRFATSTL